jgi:hypothetical protein
MGNVGFCEDGGRSDNEVHSENQLPAASTALIVDDQKSIALILGYPSPEHSYTHSSRARSSTECPAGVWCSMRTIDEREMETCWV